MTTLELFTTLRGAGVRLTPNVTTVHVDAPQGALTPALRTALREHKQELLALLENFEERAGIAQYCGALDREAAEQMAWQYVVQGEARATAAAAPEVDVRR